MCARVSLQQPLWANAWMTGAGKWGQEAGRQEEVGERGTARLSCECPEAVTRFVHTGGTVIYCCVVGRARKGRIVLWEERTQRPEAGDVRNRQGAGIAPCPSDSDGVLRGEPILVALMGDSFHWGKFPSVSSAAFHTSHRT